MFLNIYVYKSQPWPLNKLHVVKVFKRKKSHLTTMTVLIKPFLCFVFVMIVDRVIELFKNRFACYMKLYEYFFDCKSYGY